MDIDYIKKILRNIKSPLETEGLFTTIAIAFKSEFENELHRRFIEELETRLTNLSRDFFHFVIHRTDNTVYTILIQFFPGSSDIKMIHFEIQLEQAFLESLQKFHLAGFLQIGPRCKKIQSLSIVWHETIHHLAEKKYPQKEIEKKTT